MTLQRSIVMLILLFVSVWSTACTRIKPGADLSGADLSGQDLREAEFSSFNGLKLLAVNLSGANLSEANLEGADVHGVNLSGANLSRANLKNANLRTADLSLADLSGADLRGAALWSANVNGATLSKANLVGADLSGIKDLTDEMLHTVAGGGSLWLAAVQEDIAQVCQGSEQQTVFYADGTPVNQGRGGGITQAAPYDDGVGPHPIIVLEFVEKGNYWSWSTNWYKLPEHLFPSEIQFTQLVACISEGMGEGQTCYYDNGATETQYRHRVTIQIRRADSGEVIMSETLLGEASGPCSETIYTTGSGHSISNGPEVSNAEIRNWIVTHAE